MQKAITIITGIIVIVLLFANSSCQQQTTEAEKVAFQQQIPEVISFNFHVLWHTLM